MNIYLDSALTMVRQMHEIVYPLGFCVALTGSILIKGSSDNDIDIIIYPFNTGQINIEKFWEKLESLGWQRVMTRSGVATKWERKSFDMKNVEKWKSPEGFSVDLFYMS